MPAETVGMADYSRRPDRETHALPDEDTAISERNRLVYFTAERFAGVFGSAGGSRRSRLPAADRDAGDRVPATVAERRVGSPAGIYSPAPRPPPCRHDALCLTPSRGRTVLSASEAGSSSPRRLCERLRASCSHIRRCAPAFQARRVPTPGACTSSYRDRGGAPRASGARRRR